eukprot:scaffold5855_cov117-Isochrysis_galbana.AAC.7
MEGDRGARGVRCANLCGRSTSYPTSLLPAAAGVRSTAPPAGKEGPGSGSEWKNGAKCPVLNFSSWIHWLTKAVGTSFKELILPPYHRATSWSYGHVGRERRMANEKHEWGAAVWTVNGDVGGWTSQRAE